MINAALQAIAASFEGVNGYSELFGIPPDGITPELHVKAVYRQLVKDLHPDRYIEEDDKKVANDLFAKLTLLHEEALNALKLNTFGSSSVLMTVRTKKMEHQIIRFAKNGDLTNGYESTTKFGTEVLPTFTKVAKNAADNDLLKTEARALKKFRADGTEEKWWPYVSGLVDHFLYAEVGKPRLEANVLWNFEGFYTLEEIQKAFPNGVSPLHAAWMWRRLLMGMGYAHDEGVVHGAVFPQHILISPQQHGVVLIDWCYSSIKSDSGYPPIVAVVDDYKSWYPDEVLSKKAPSPATDIYLASRTFVKLLGGNPLTAVFPNTVPMQIQAFFRGCLLSKQHMRPQNAWELLKEFDELLERIGAPFFPRKFREFVMPTGMTSQKNER